MGAIKRPMEPAQDIDALIARVALRDRQAFARLYAATSAKLFGVVLRILGNRPEAEDALQEIYVKIWNRAGTYAAGTHSPMSWLIAVARHQAIDMLRQRAGARAPAHVVIEEAAEIADGAPDAEARLLMKGERGILDGCLARLEADRAEAVRRAYLDGWSYDDLARHFDVPLNTMRTWLRRSLLKLRECLES
jgi:RNA polymerase sigma-70 factor, ECF subfamily